MSPGRLARLRVWFERALEAGPEARPDVIAGAEADEAGFGEELRALLQEAEAPDDGFGTLDAVAATLLVEEAGGDPLPGNGRLGRFEVLERLGAGGMGVTYRAWDPQLDRAVALKVLTRAPLLPDGGREALLREARAASQLDHPGIATVYDVGQADDGRVFLAMALYEGTTLAERLAEGPLATPEAIEVGRRIAEALAAAHAAGIVHRDVKPGNIMLLPDGSVRVLDFGIATGRSGADASDDSLVGHVPSGSGTPAYMSPEQKRGAEVDARTDVYAMGVVLREMFGGDDTEAGPAVQSVLHRCLAEDPDERFDDAGDLATALVALEASTSSKTPSGWIAVGLLIVTILVAVGWWGLARPSGPAEPIIAVLPLEAVTSDEAASGLGRDLAVTIAMSLGTLDGFTVLDPVVLLGRREFRDPGAGRAERVVAARELGATRLVTGSLVGEGEGVRVELRMGADPATAPDWQTSFTVPGLSVNTLTDSLAWRLLRGIWEEGVPPTPSLSGLTTESFEALGHFLRGERAMVEGRFRDAPAHYARAVAGDSAFTLAHWRLWWSLDWYGQPIPDATVGHVTSHLGDLSPRDSVMAQAAMEPDQFARRELLRELAESNPRDWLAWFAYQDFMVHSGGGVGVELAESRDALERLVTLRPDLVRGWDHLVWVAREQRDLPGMNHALDRLEALSYDSLSLSQGGFDDLFYLRLQARTLASGGIMNDSDVGAGLSVLTRSEGPTGQLRLASNLMSEGLGRAQLQLTDTIAALDVPASVRTAMEYARSLALARRGRWEEALDAAEAYAEGAPTTAGILHGLRLSAVGAILGVSATGAVDAWATRAPGQSASEVAPGWSPEERVEVDWLLGLSALAGDDPSEVAGPIRRLESEANEDARNLGRSLDLIRTGLSGDSAVAARAMVEFIESGERGLRRSPRGAPFFEGVIRLLAARWIADADVAAARGLLTWHEEVLPDNDDLWMVIRATRILEPLAHVERAGLEATSGRPGRAEWHQARAVEALTEGDASVQALIQPTNPSN